MDFTMSNMLMGSNCPNTFNTMISDELMNTMFPPIDYNCLTGGVLPQWDNIRLMGPAYQIPPLPMAPAMYVPPIDNFGLLSPAYSNDWYNLHADSLLPVLPSPPSSYGQAMPILPSPPISNISPQNEFRDSLSPVVQTQPAIFGSKGKEKVEHTHDRYRVRKLAPSARLVPRVPASFPSPAVAGPFRSSIVLPPRQKPGRKPATTPAPTPKKNANRKAAQKHRQKAQDKQQEEFAEIARQKEREKQAFVEQALREESLRLQNKRKRSSESISFSHAHNKSTNVSPSPSVIPPLSITVPKPAAGGCGRCVEGGNCPCVDNLIDLDQEKDSNLSTPLQQLSVTSPTRQFTPRLEISDLLNPKTPGKHRKSTTPVALSHSELEIDFTKAFRNGYDPVIGSHAPNRCGACDPNDKGSCLCRKASLAAARSGSDVSSPASSRATSSVPSGPGTCARCQADPQQRAWCQSLARQQTPISPMQSTEPPEKVYKRARQHEETISCSEAYGVHQRFSERHPRKLPTPPVSADEVLQSVKERPREYSAFEVDIGTILSNLKHCDTRRSSTR